MIPVPAGGRGAMECQAPAMRLAKAAERLAAELKHPGGVRDRRGTAKVACRHEGPAIQSMPGAPTGRSRCKERRPRAR